MKKIQDQSVIPCDLRSFQGLAVACEQCFLPQLALDVVAEEGRALLQERRQVHVRVLLLEVVQLLREEEDSIHQIQDTGAH